MRRGYRERSTTALDLGTIQRLPAALMVAAGSIGPEGKRLSSPLWNQVPVETRREPLSAGPEGWRLSLAPQDDVRSRPLPRPRPLAGQLGHALQYLILTRLARVPPLRYD